MTAATTALRIALVGGLLAACTGGTAARTPDPASTDVHRSSGEGSVHDALVTVDGRQRAYRLFVPPDLPPLAPLVIVLHGSGGTPGQYQDGLGYDAVASFHRFLVAYPAGEHGTWNAGQTLTYGADSDDVTFLVSLVDDVDATSRVDRRRVYLTGHSAGGWMAYRAGCERSDVFAAIAPVGSALMVRCSPARPLPVLHVQGELDGNIPLGVATSSVQEMARANGCAPTPGVERVGRVTFTRYVSCRAGSEVVLAAVAGAGHDWPVEARGFSATERGWEFLARHVLPA